MISRALQIKDAKESRLYVFGIKYRLPLRGAIRGHNIIWRKLYYISFNLHPRTFDNFTSILLYTLWNVQNLLSKINVEDTVVTKWLIYEH